MRYLDRSYRVGMMCGVVAAAWGVGCQPFEDPVEPVCTQIDVIPEATVLPADGASQTWVDLAVCLCPETPEAQPCTEDTLMAGRYLYLSADRGTLRDEWLYLRTGRGETVLTSSAIQEMASVTAWTDDGWTGAGNVQFYGPLALGEDAISLGVGESRPVEVIGAVLPLEEPVVTGDVALGATFDEDTSLLVVAADEDVAWETTVSVTLVDALGQLATLSVTVLPGPVAPEGFTMTAETSSLTASGVDFTKVTVHADNVVDGTTAYLNTTLGSLAANSLTLAGGEAETLFFAGVYDGTALLYATIGEFVSEPLLIDIAALEDPAGDE